MMICDESYREMEGNRNMEFMQAWFIKYDIPVCHEGHKGHEGHEDISSYLHFSDFLYISLQFSALPTCLYQKCFWEFTITGNILTLKHLRSLGFGNRGLAAVSRISLKPRAQTSFCPPHGFQLQRFRFRGKSDFLRWRLAVFYLPRPWISVFLWTFCILFISIVMIVSTIIIITMPCGWVGINLTDIVIMSSPSLSSSSCGWAPSRSQLDRHPTLSQYWAKPRWRHCNASDGEDDDDDQK